VFACFERFGTELLIVDECQHLNYRNGLKNDVTDTLKGMLDAGFVPMVFLGTEDAEQMFKRNLQLNGRLLAPCDLLPLNSRNVDDRRLFAVFVAKLEQAIVDQGVLPEQSRLGDAGLLPALKGLLVACHDCSRWRLRSLSGVELRDWRLTISRWLSIAGRSPNRS
jgi:hypothetical protein